MNRKHIALIVMVVSILFFAVGTLVIGPSGTPQVQVRSASDEVTAPLDTITVPDTTTVAPDTTTVPETTATTTAPTPTTVVVVTHTATAPTTATTVVTQTVTAQPVAPSQDAPVPTTTTTIDYGPVHNQFGLIGPPGLAASFPHANLGTPGPPWLCHELGYAADGSPVVVACGDTSVTSPVDVYYPYLGDPTFAANHPGLEVYQAGQAADGTLISLIDQGPMNQ